MIRVPLHREAHAPLLKADRRLVVALDVPRSAAGLVLLAQARGTVRAGLLSHGIVPVLRATGLATCVVDLVEVTEAEDPLRVCNVNLLTRRLAGVVQYLAMHRVVGRLPLAILGRESAAAAAIRLAAEDPRRVRAVVSCAGRPDLAGIDPAGYQVPTLLLVPGRARGIVRANEKFFVRVGGECQLAVIEDASRIGESGTLADCQKVIYSWCVRYLGIPGDWPEKLQRRGGPAALPGALVHG